MSKISRFTSNVVQLAKNAVGERGEVRRQEHDAVVGLDALEEGVHLGVGVAIGGVRNLRSVAKHRVGLVEQQGGVGLLGGLRNLF